LFCCEFELGRLEGLAYFQPILSSSGSIDVPIFDDADAEPDRTHRLEIFQVDPACPLTNASITIVDNDLPFSPGFGANGSVLKSIKLRDGGALLAGVFTHVNSSSSPGLTRLKPSGLIDRTFIPPFRRCRPISTTAHESRGRNQLTASSRIKRRLRAPISRMDSISGRQIVSYYR
jgi:hypothetical protein